MLRPCDARGRATLRTVTLRLPSHRLAPVIAVACGGVLPLAAGLVGWPDGAPSLWTHVAAADAELGRATLGLAWVSFVGLVMWRLVSVAVERVERTALPRLALGSVLLAGLCAPASLAALSPAPVILALALAAARRDRFGAIIAATAVAGFALGGVTATVAWMTGLLWCVRADRPRAANDNAASQRAGAFAWKLLNTRRFPLGTAQSLQRVVTPVHQ